jgi:drug/metabolite transporter (DMT)-like permease
MFFDFWLTNFKGELAAVGTAFLWAMSAIVWGRIGKYVPPIGLNFLKVAIAIALLMLTLLLRSDLLPKISPIAVLQLMLSGILGIGLGDTFYFEALNYLGARRALLMEALAPPLSALLALLFLGEQLSLSNWLGIALTIAGVAWVVSEAPRHNTQLLTTTSKSHTLWGVGYGLLAVVGQSSGAVLSHGALADSSISPLWSSLLRLGAGGLVLLLWIVAQKPVDLGLNHLRSKQLLLIITVTAFFSTYLGILLQQTSLKYTAAGVAQALANTSPLFILPVAAWMGDTVSFRAILGVFIALGGVGLLFS